MATGSAFNAVWDEGLLFVSLLFLFLSIFCMYLIFNSKKSKKIEIPIQKGKLMKNDNYSDVVPKLPEFDLMQLNLLQMTKELKGTIDSNKWVIFKGWGNRRLELDVKRQRMIIQQIEDLGLAAETLAHTQAKVFLGQQLFEAELASFENQLKLSAKKFKDELQKIDDEAKARELALKEKETSVLLQGLRGKAEVEMIKAQTEEHKARAKMMTTLVDKIMADEQPLPEFLISLIGAAVFGSRQEITSDMQLMNKMEEYILRKAEAETKEIESQADLSRANADDSIRVIKNSK